MYPARIVRSAWTSHGAATAERISAAVSMTAPEALTHEWSCCCER